MSRCTLRRGGPREYTTLHSALKGNGTEMLERLELENVGPAPKMALELAPRMNLITGDNGLGKSFLLDVAWWALTRRISLRSGPTTPIR